MSIIDTRFEFEVLFLLSLLLDYGRIINILCMRFYVFCFLCTTNSPHILDWFEIVQSMVWGSDLLSKPDILGSYFYERYV